MVWRRRWARVWDEVRYCSVAAAPAGVTVDVERATAEVVAGDPDIRRDAARDAARRIAASGDAELIAAGRAADPATARGPLGLRRR